MLACAPLRVANAGKVRGNLSNDPERRSATVLLSLCLSRDIMSAMEVGGMGVWAVGIALYDRMLESEADLARTFA